MISTPQKTISLRSKINKVKKVEKRTKGKLFFEILAVRINNKSKYITKKNRKKGDIEEFLVRKEDNDINVENIF